MSPVFFHGRRDEQGKLHVTKQVDDLAPVPIDLRLDLRSHSPAGPEVGYSGSGPAQLSLALLADALGDDDLARELYQRYKRQVIARLPQDEPFTISAESIEAWAASLARPTDQGTGA